MNRDCRCHLTLSLLCLIADGKAPYVSQGRICHTTEQNSCDASVKKPTGREERNPRHLQQFSTDESGVFIFSPSASPAAAPERCSQERAWKGITIFLLAQKSETPSYKAGVSYPTPTHRWQNLLELGSRQNWLFTRGASGEVCERAHAEENIFLCPGKDFQALQVGGDLIEFKEMTKVC